MCTYIVPHGPIGIKERVLLVVKTPRLKTSIRNNSADENKSEYTFCIDCTPCHTVWRKACFCRHGRRARKRRRNDFMFDNFLFVKSGNVYLKSESENFYGKIEKIKYFTLKHNFLKIRLKMNFEHVKYV